jgi:hypothetical protein
LLIISRATRTLSHSSAGVMNRKADSRSETGLARMKPSTAGVWYLVRLVYSRQSWQPGHVRLAVSLRQRGHTG